MKKKYYNEMLKEISEGDVIGIQKNGAVFFGKVHVINEYKIELHIPKEWEYRNYVTFYYGDIQAWKFNGHLQGWRFTQ